MRLAGVVRSPDKFQQLAMGEYSSGMPHQCDEQFVFGRSEVHLDIVPEYPSRPDVHS